MKALFWVCGLAAVLVGCSSDPGYVPPGRTPLLSERTLQPAPGTPATWQQNGQSGALAHRTPMNMPQYGAGAQAYTPPARTWPSSGEPIQPAPLAQGAPFQQPSPAPTGITPGMVGPGGTPGSLPSLASQASAPSFPPVQQAGFEDKPLRVVPPDTLPRTEAARAPVPSPAVPTETPRPLLMATQEKPEKSDKAMEESPLDRKTMRPPTPSAEQPEQPAASPPTLAGPTVSDLPGREEKSALDAKGLATPAVRMVNSKRIVLNYEIKDVGPSGVSSVELWYTKDGKTWQKDEAAVRKGPPYTIEVPEEGMYGFTLVAKNGVGIGKQPPQPGDMPQVWVEVDLTKPVVSLLDVKHGTGTKAREITINWSAHDRNLARRPITLSYSEHADGPWLPLAANIDNSGQYVWQMPSSGPATFFTRVEAVDLVGNVGSAQSAKALSIDTSQPTVSITGVEPAER